MFQGLRNPKMLSWIETPQRKQYHIPVVWNPIAGSELHFVVESKLSLYIIIYQESMASGFILGRNKCVKSENP